MMIRYAEPKDVDAIMSWVTASPDFDIAEPYTEAEMLEWIGDSGAGSKTTCVLVMEVEEDSPTKSFRLPHTIGFLFAKRMSEEWWTMEALFVQKEYRDLGAAKIMVDYLVEHIKTWGGEFVNTVVKDRADYLTAAGALGFRGRSPRMVICEMWIPKKEVK